MNTSSLVDQCYNQLPNHMKAKPWEFTEHGRKVLQSEDELNAYIAAYGEMHIVKCRAALQNFPFEDKGFEMYSYEIFDWGCGQGLATLTLLEMLQERGKLSRLKCIYLIEPSSYALKRATSWVKQYVGPGIEVESINSYIPKDNNAIMGNVSCSSRISINLFSNILDIRDINLSWLARKTASLADRNYMVCVGPKFIQNTNTRIADFCGYFNPGELFSNINIYPYSYTSRTHHAYGCETKCFVYHKEKTLDSNYQECAEEYLCPDPYDYASEVLNGTVDDKIIRFYNRLRQTCESSYDVFYRPAINCDSVDFVLASKSQCILLVNVCENLEDLWDSYQKIKSVKNNLFNIHLKSIKIDYITNSNVYGCIKTALFFPNNTQEEVISKFHELSTSKNEEQDFKYLQVFTVTSNIKDQLEKISRPSGYKFEYYEELVNIISTNWHSYKDGDCNLKLSQRQKEIVRSDNKRIRVKGVAGCGKTQVVAYRAVEQLIKTGERVLILTFNISLVQYIKMRISQVPADFFPNMFEIINYHQFFKSKANLYAPHKNVSMNDYDDPDFFSTYRKQIKKYKNIIIDEAQDFKEPWIQSVVSNFLSEDGSVALFGDGEQNIYSREMEKETQMPHVRNCGFPGGKWKEMSERISMRWRNPQIASLCSKFAKNFLKNDTPIEMQELLLDGGIIKYWDIDCNTTGDILARNICWIMSEYKLKPDDVVVLCQSISILRKVEETYKAIKNMSTMINFETESQHKDVQKKGPQMFINKNLDEVRRAAKTHFTTACDKIKLSTIHSFKGWESNTVILIIQPEMQIVGAFDDGYSIHSKLNNEALIYTALSRAKCNLFILNLGNDHYHQFFSDNIQ